MPRFRRACTPTSLPPSASPSTGRSLAPGTDSAGASTTSETPPARSGVSRAGAARLRVPMLRLRVRPAHRPHAAPDWRPRTSSGTTSADRTSSPTVWRCARCTTSCSIWARSRSSPRSTASSSASTRSRATRAGKANCATTVSALIAAQHASLRPGQPFLAWNHKNVFKDPARAILAARALLPKRAGL
ncbi:MAG: hypothetical protein MZW92_44930 [Comamonadaceae bacterium]|nr:hypothetical protein [Comamonadaceae bacterium]